MKPALCLFLFAAALSAQTDGITTIVSRTVYVQPDQIEATISITTPATVSATQAANVLQNAGVPSRMISAGSSDLLLANRPILARTSSFVYSFVHTVPGNDMRDLAKKLETLQNTRSADYSNLSYATALTVSQAAADDQFQRVLPQLIADAKKRAETLAAAAGLRVGAVQTISESLVPVTSTGYASAILGGVISSSVGSRTALTFTVAVKFAVN
jgi:uncharacterized protein YggE